MSASVKELEREVDEARTRLNLNLDRLRSPDAVGQLKRELWTEAAKFGDRLLDDVKARVVANPGAVAAIGAGIAWRLVRHPPVSSLLVGFGLFSLFKTKPVPGAPTSFSVDFGASREDAAKRLKEVGEGTATRLKELGEEAARGGAEAAKAVSHVADQSLQAVSNVADQSLHAVAKIAADETVRDQVLLGLAAASIAAAVGIAATRQLPG